MLYEVITTESNLKQRSCWITHTNPEVHGELELGFEASPMFDGTIQGTGPRYCPSIESKLITFSEKEQEGQLLDDFVDIDVLKVAHHGSITSSARNNFV